MQHGNPGITSALAAEGGVLPSHGSVLRIVVENVFYPVTLDVLYQVMRIVLKSRNLFHCCYCKSINLFF